MRDIERHLKTQVHKMLRGQTPRPTGKENETPLRQSGSRREFYDSFESSDFSSRRMRGRS